MRHKTSFIFPSLCFALVSCTPKLDSDQTRSLGDESINGITTSIDSPGETNSATPSEPFFVSATPQDLVFRNQKYEMITLHSSETKDMELDTIIGYFINREDYDRFSSENSDAEYAVNEGNSIYYAYGENKMLIYSVVGYPVDELIAVVFPKHLGTPDFFRKALSETRKEL